MNAKPPANRHELPSSVCPSEALALGLGKDGMFNRTNGLSVQDFQGLRFESMAWPCESRARAWGVTRGSPTLRCASDSVQVKPRVRELRFNRDPERAPACRVQGEKSWAQAAQEGGSGIEPVETLESPVLL